MSARLHGPDRRRAPSSDCGGVADARNHHRRLYDQAQLLDVYLDAYLLTDDSDMLACVNDIADYLTTDALAAPDGAFYSAEDADSYYRPGDTEKREGAFYVWTRKEFDDVLGERAAEICARHWNVKRHGNVSPEHDAHDELTNQNVLNVVATPAQLARDFGMAEDDVVRVVEASRRKLRDHRDKDRPRPNLDDKIVTSWNGLAIGSLARAGAALEHSDPQRASRYRRRAAGAARFVRDNLFDEDTSKLRRVYRDGPGDVWGFADDYAFTIQGLIELYEATFDESYLAFADRLQSELRLPPPSMCFFVLSSPPASGKFLLGTLPMSHPVASFSPDADDPPPPLLSPPRIPKSASSGTRCRRASSRPSRRRRT